MRIAALSDQHGIVSFELPTTADTDLILHAGDICPDHPSRGMSQDKWLWEKWRPWLPTGVPVLATYGNHDFLGRRHFPDMITIDAVREVDGLRVWLSPWSNQFGSWAWMMQPDELERIYDQIPADIDIIVSHQPPYCFGDKVEERFLIGNENPHVGSKQLLAAIERVAPQVVVCGHIHSGRGTYEMRHRRGTTTIYNVAVVNESYQRVHPVTCFEITPRALSIRGASGATVSV